MAADGVLSFGAAPAWTARTSLALGPTRFVVTVRDPVAVNISFFLYWGRRFWIPAEFDRIEGLSDREVARLFVTRYPHHSVLRWMSREFTPATGLATDTAPFDTGRAAAVVSGHRASALIMRSDLADERKQVELTEFLGTAIAPVPRGNSIEELLGSRRSLHARFSRVVAGIPGYVDALLDDPFTCWYWSASERAAMRHRWAKLAAHRFGHECQHG